MEPLKKRVAYCIHLKRKKKQRAREIFSIQYFKKTMSRFDSA